MGEVRSGGWPPFQGDEHYTYSTEQDDRVCPICRDYGLIREFNGVTVPLEFPDLVWLYTLHLINPKVHVTHPEMRGECRCLLEWVDPVGTLTERLAAELEAVI